MVWNWDIPSYGQLFKGGLMLDLDYGRDQGQGGVRIRSVWEGVVEVKPGGKGAGVAL